MKRILALCLLLSLSGCDSAGFEAALAEVWMNDSCTGWFWEDAQGDRNCPSDASTQDALAEGSPET